MPCSIHRAADIKKLITFITFCILLSTPLAKAASEDSALSTPVFAVEERRIEQSAPYLTLAWKFPEEADPAPGARFELEVAPTEDFENASTHYRGPDMASVIFGLAEGEYFYRVRSFHEETGENSTWSEPLHLVIEYDSLAKAFLLFGIGAVVSVATVALVVVGDRRTRREENQL